MPVPVPILASMPIMVPSRSVMNSNGRIGTSGRCGRNSARCPLSQSRSKAATTMRLSPSAGETVTTGRNGCSRPGTDPIRPIPPPFLSVRSGSQAGGVRQAAARTGRDPHNRRPVPSTMAMNDNDGRSRCNVPSSAVQFSSDWRTLGKRAAMRDNRRTPSITPDRSFMASSACHSTISPWRACRSAC